MFVWTTSTNSHARVKFHASRSCSKLRQARHPVQRVELDEMDHPDPCRVCFPQAPGVPRMWRPACDQCYGGRQGPCQHNGGVLVLVEQRGRWPGRLGDGQFDPEARLLRRVYVWPENAHHYRQPEDHLAKTDQRVVADLRDRERR